MAFVMKMDQQQFLLFIRAKKTPTFWLGFSKYLFAKER